MTVGSSHTGDAADHQSVGDHHVRELIDRYVRTAGTTLTEVGPNLFDLAIPREDRTAFTQRATVRIAFSVEAVQTDGEAEMAIMGGAFVEQLIDAIRSRGSLYSAGLIPVIEVNATTLPGLPASVAKGRAEEGVMKLSRHRVGRLTSRVVIRAGTTLEEHLVDGSMFDLGTGLPLGDDVAKACDQHLQSPSPPSANQPEATVARMQPVDTLVGRMLNALEKALDTQLTALRDRSQRDLAHEVGRINRYYQALLDDMGGRGTEIPDKDSRKVYESERDRRIGEEKDRHEVRATVHPVQVTQWEVFVQRVDWPLISDDGYRGTITAQRTLAGEHKWVFGCPACGTADPKSVSVCLKNHVACESCARSCTVCATTFCVDHGIAQCHVDRMPACDEHSRTCKSCHKRHCSSHQGECVDGGHAACTECLAPCAICQRTICDRHAEKAASDAPRGVRRFCRDCSRKCEGGSGEVVGSDEVAKCSSCSNVVCARHQSTCAVDGHVHCSKHLRRTDRSRRLVCEKDRAACSYEPNAVFAKDEIAVCATCGRKGCTDHVGRCIEDGTPHCKTHLLPVGDRPGEMVCEAHRMTCHVDGGAFTRAGVRNCVLCNRLVCDGHRANCGNCGRSVCVGDFRSGATACATCVALKETDDPSDSMLAAGNQLFERAGKAKRWKSARDATHTVVEADLGWTRRIVFSLRHADNALEYAMARSALGSRRLKV